MEKRDDRKADYKVADQRSPRQRERDLLEAARAEGRPQPADGSRPLSAAHPERKDKEEGGLKHLLETGLPPGIDEEDAEDPGARGNPGAPARNRS
jgi:hypothetical protein